MCARAHIKNRGALQRSPDAPGVKYAFRISRARRRCRLEIVIYTRRNRYTVGTKTSAVKFRTADQKCRAFSSTLAPKCVVCRKKQIYVTRARPCNFAQLIAQSAFEIEFREYLLRSVCARACVCVHLLILFHMYIKNFLYNLQSHTHTHTQLSFQFLARVFYFLNKLKHNTRLYY